MKRAAIYAGSRMDGRDERSCRERMNLCSAWAEQSGLTVVASFSDQAPSGATITRLELARLQRAARNREFEVLVVETLDDLSHDETNLEAIRQNLSSADVSIVTIRANDIDAEVKREAPANTLARADLARRTRLGQSERVRAGAFAGGRCYGYDPVPNQPGELTVNAAEAAVVRRIFALYVDGKSPRAIAALLNTDAVPGPRGGRWNASTINGSRSRANGIIANALYVGEIVWNRQRFVRDTATGKRIAKLNPPEAWIRTEAPELQIVDTETFVAANAAKARKGSVRPEFSRAPRHMLSGLLSCTCGAPFIVVGANGRFGCARHRESGDCDNAATITRDELERRVFGALETRLAEPEIIAEFVRQHQRERNQLAQEAIAERKAVEERVRSLRTMIERIVDRVVAGTAPDAMVERMDAMEAERKALEARIGAANEEPLPLHPSAADQLRRLAANLRAHLSRALSDGQREAFADEVRKLIDRVEIGHRPHRGAQAPITVYGALADLLLASGGEQPMLGNIGCGDLHWSLPATSFTA